MNNKDIIDVALRQSSIDYCVSVNDLVEGKYSIFRAKEIPGDARNYLDKAPYCNLFIMELQLWQL